MGTLTDRNAFEVNRFAPNIALSATDTFSDGRSRLIKTAEIVLSTRSSGMWLQKWKVREISPPRIALHDGIFRRCFIDFFLLSAEWLRKMWNSVGKFGGSHAMSHRLLTLLVILETFGVEVEISRVDLYHKISFVELMRFVGSFTKILKARSRRIHRNWLERMTLHWIVH